MIGRPLGVVLGQLASATTGGFPAATAPDKVTHRATIHNPCP